MVIQSMIIDADAIFAKDGTVIGGMPVGTSFRTGIPNSVLNLKP